MIVYFIGVAVVFGLGYLWGEMLARHKWQGLADQALEAWRQAELRQHEARKLVNSRHHD